MVSEFVPPLSLTTDVAQAAWLADSVLEHGVAGSFVPTGLEAYAQILHPAEASEGDPVRWREVTDWLQAPLHAGVWFDDLEELAAGKPTGDRPWTYAPREGHIPDEVLDGLTPVLARHTTSEHGLFCLWDGWAIVTGSVSRMVGWSVDHPPRPGTPSHFHARPAFPAKARKSSTIHLPMRGYFLFEGPLVAAGELGVSVTWDPGGARTFERQTPSLWWPDDQAWCAGNEIDAGFSCIGGSRALIDALLAHPELEVLELDPTLEFSPYAGVDHDDR